MNIYQLQNFLKLSKKLHFSEVAKDINLAQPALSRQIKQLEIDFNAKLFKRNSRKVELTEAGKYLSEEVENLLTKLKQIKYKTQQIDAGENVEIRIGFTHSVMQPILPEIIKTIHKTRPNAQIILKELNNQRQFEGIQNKELDFCFATNPIIPTNLKGMLVQSENFVVLLPKNHKINNKNYTNFSLFSEDNFIFPPLEDGTNYLRLLESICIESGFSPKVKHITGSASTSFKLVEAGMGICIEPKISVKNLNLPLEIIELKNITQKAKLAMIWGNEFENEYPDLVRSLKIKENYNI